MSHLAASGVHRQPSTGQQPRLHSRPAAAEVRGKRGRPGMVTLATDGAPCYRMSALVATTGTNRRCDYRAIALILYGAAS